MNEFNINYYTVDDPELAAKYIKLAQLKLTELQGRQKEMTSFKQTAQDYEPERMKNIADLEEVSVEVEVKEETRQGQDGPYKVKFIVVGDSEYRVPNSVIEQLQSLLLEKPDIKTFKVKKSGENLNTKYQVIQLE